jgi:hypothetical protein
VGVYKMSRTKKWIILITAGALVLMALIAFATAPHKNIGNSERERGGPPSVSLSNTNKLAATLSTSQFVAAKNDISDYILKRVSGQAQSAKIDSTQLNADGQITLDVTVDNGESFTATVNQSDNQLIFQVASDHTKVVNNVPDDGGGDDDD